MNLFSKLFRSRDKPRNHIGGLSFLFDQTAAGKPVNERTAMQTTAVYACVRILAESIAGLPLHVYAYQGQGKERVPESAALPAPRCAEPRDDLLYISRNNDESPSFVGKCLRTNFA